MLPAVTHVMGGGVLAVFLAKSRQQAEEILKTYKLFAI
jgi:hypothetical protein